MGPQPSAEPLLPRLLPLPLLLLQQAGEPPLRVPLQETPGKLQRNIQPPGHLRYLQARLVPSHAQRDPQRVCAQGRPADVAQAPEQAGPGELLHMLLLGCDPAEPQHAAHLRQAPLIRP